MVKNPEIGGQYWFVTDIWERFCPVPVTIVAVNEEYGALLVRWDMEGMTTIEKDTYVIQFHKKKILLYAGELSNNVNLQDLIETIINRSKLEIELWICGKGGELS